MQGSLYQSISKQQKQEVATPCVISNNAMCLDAVLLNTGLWEISGIFTALFLFLFTTIFEGFTHISEPEVVVSLHPAHCGRDAPCCSLYKLQIVLKVDSATGFLESSTVCHYSRLIFKGFVVDGIRSNGGYIEGQNKIWPPQCYNCDLLYIYDTEPVFQSSDGGSSEVVLNSVLLAKCFKMLTGSCFTPA